jgi:ribonuclease VapC
VILDTSAVIAIIRREPGFEELVRSIAAAPVIGIGAPTLAEAAIVLTARFGADARGLLATLLRDFEIDVVPFGEAHWQEALTAFERFGKGRHPAALNFGDCLSYAAAQVSKQPLLAIGDDFPRTDLALAAP